MRRRPIHTCDLLMGRWPWLIGSGVFALASYTSVIGGQTDLAVISAGGAGLYLGVGLMVGDT